MTGQDHMEGKLAHHGIAHINKAVGGLLQQQSTAQVRVLYTEVGEKGPSRMNPLQIYVINLLV